MCPLLLDRHEALPHEGPVTPWRRAALPADLTSFVGRRAERSEIRRLLAASRMVTVTGAGGVGKSRLALQAARDMQRAFPDGVWMVGLAGGTAPATVREAVAATFDLRREAVRAGDLAAVVG